MSVEAALSNLKVGVGLGGGIVLDGKLFGGVGGYAGEFGHMTIANDGELCNCGNRLLGDPGQPERGHQARPSGH